MAIEAAYLASQVAEELTLDQVVELAEVEHRMATGQAHRNVVTRLAEGLLLHFRGRSDRLVLSEVVVVIDPTQKPPPTVVPDLAIVVGLPQADYRSYPLDGDHPVPTVVLEIVSENDTAGDNHRKLRRHAELGVAELWFLHPETGSVNRYTLQGDKLLPAFTDGRCEALDGVIFDGSSGQLVPRFPDGRAFPDRTSTEYERAEAEKARAEAERARAEAEKARADRLAAKLRELGVDPEAV